MQRFASHLELQDFRARTIHGYYRQMRLIADHFWQDPARLSDQELRDYYVYTRCELEWAPKTMRTSLSAAKHFYRGMLKRKCPVLDDIKARDREHLPDVLTQEEVRRLFPRIPLRRYRTPLLLMYACGLRVRECIHLTVDDISGPDNRLFVRDGKGGKDRWTILSTPMYRELQDYWRIHRNPKWLFPAVGRGASTSAMAAERMRAATDPMDTHSLRTRLLAAARAAKIRKKRDLRQPHYRNRRRKGAYPHPQSRYQRGGNTAHY
ncbi:MAG: tyrosine-type recombinase/integrase [Opitutales bacterium]